MKLYFACLNDSWQEKEHITYNINTTSKWKITSSAEKMNKGKAPAQAVLKTKGFQQDSLL